MNKIPASNLNTPVISIVTPSFRQFEWSKLCARSIDDQQSVAFEHLIQDAGTGPELAAWMEANTRARVFVEKDDGMYDAINRGFARAAGEIVAWLNCDEQYLPGTLARVALYFEEHPEVDVLFGDAVLLDDQGEILSYRKVLKPTLLHTQLVHLCTFSCATFVRRRVIERGILPETRWKTIADGVWVAAMLRAKLKMAVLGEPLSTFTMTGKNLGQAPIAVDERKRWSREMGAAVLLKAPVIVLHRIRKLLDGAYRRRDIAVEVYTTESPERRVVKSRTDVSFHWPGDAASSTE